MIAFKLKQQFSIFFSVCQVIFLTFRILVDRFIILISHNFYYAKLAFKSSNFSFILNYLIFIDMNTLRMSDRQRKTKEEPKEIEKTKEEAQEYKAPELSLDDFVDIENDLNPPLF